MSDLRIDEGLGSFVFHDGAVAPRGFMRVFSFRPPQRDSRIVIAMHGLDRAAAAFRDVLAVGAAQHGLIVLVPEFDVEAFPDHYAYNYGNVVTAPPQTTVMPRSRWTFDIVERLFCAVTASLGSQRATFSLFGNSAGAQYVLRYLALNEARAVDRALAANSGWYMLPDLAVGYPEGMGGIGLDESNLRRYFASPLTILLGDADTDTAAADLPRMEAAIAQGPHRLARGQWYFQHCREAAVRRGMPFGWTLDVVAGAGHITQAIYDRAAATLAKIVILSMVCWSLFAADASAASCRAFAKEAQAAIKTHVAALQRLEHEASDRTKGLDTRPFAVIRDEARKALAIIADPVALADEEDLKRCRNPTTPIRAICAGSAQLLVDVLEKHLATTRPDYDKPQYAAAIAECEKLMDLKPLKTVIRGTE
jgi:hypothetical protein